MRISDWSSDVCSSDLLAWSRLLRRRVEPFVNVGDEEVEGIIERLKEAQGSEEYRVGEIFLSATPENKAEVMANAERIAEQIRGGASFIAYARQFSQASSAAVGGDLGWMRAARQSGVEGKSVSVRVDLGGRRLLK